MQKIPITLAVAIYSLIVIYGIYLYVLNWSDKKRKRFTGEIIVDSLFAMVMLSASSFGLYVAIGLWQDDFYLNMNIVALMVASWFLITCIKGLYDLITFK